MPGRAVGHYMGLPALKVSQTGGGDFTTLTAAKTAARSGDTIIVYPGTYAENNLLKDGVNWFFMPGAVVDYTIRQTDTRGIFDDQDGAVTCTVDGAGVFRLTDTNAHSNSGNATILGLVVITNSATDFRLRAAELNATAWVSFAGLAVYVSNCAFVSVDVKRIIDPNFGTTIEDADNLGTFLHPASYGVWWLRGETYVRVSQIKVAQYSIYAEGPNDTNVAANLWVTASYVESNASNCVYISGRTGANYRTWLRITEIMASGLDSSLGYNIGGGGRHYLTCDKITAASGTVVSTAGDGGIVPTLWLRALKLTGSAINLLLVQDGTVFANVDHYEDLSAVVSAIKVQAGVLHLSGGYAKVLNGVGITHAGGSADISGLKVDTSNTNSAGNYPALVSAAGLILRNCVLLAPALSECVHSAAAQTITNYGSVANKAKSGNITVNVAAITVDANVV